MPVNGRVKELEKDGRCMDDGEWEEFSDILIWRGYGEGLHPPHNRIDGSEEADVMIYMIV